MNRRLCSVRDVACNDSGELSQLAADTGLPDEEISLTGSILRKSHRQSGQRVATEKTM